MQLHRTDNSPMTPQINYLFHIPFQQLYSGMIKQHDCTLWRKKENRLFNGQPWLIMVETCTWNSRRTFGNCWRKGARRLSASTRFTSPVPRNLIGKASVFMKHSRYLLILQVSLKYSKDLFTEKTKTIILSSLQLGDKTRQASSITWV